MDTTPCCAGAFMDMSSALPGSLLIRPALACVATCGMMPPTFPWDLRLGDPPHQMLSWEQMGMVALPSTDLFFSWNAAPRGWVPCPRS